MKSKREPKMIWNPEEGIAKCILTIDGQQFIGEAKCCETDKDMMSEKTGCTIAYARARIKYYIHLKDNDIKPALAALKHLYNNISCGKTFNKNSRENYLLRRSIRQKESELDTIKDMIDTEKEELSRLIKEKDLFYKAVRANRLTGQN